MVLVVLVVVLVLVLVVVGLVRRPSWGCLVVGWGCWACWLVGWVGFLGSVVWLVFGGGQ